MRFRELRGVSQSGLARAAGIARSTLNAIEGGQARDMRVSTLERLCHSLGVSADALLGLSSLDLVRRPHLKGLALGEIDFGKAWACPTCGSTISPRALHLPGDCMIMLADLGATGSRIAALFGLSVKTVAIVLAEEKSIRRHRRF